MSDPVAAFLGNGKLNEENMFIDEDAAAPDGCSCVSIGAIFTFVVPHAAPHAIKVVSSTLPGSKAIAKLVARVNAGGHASVAAALTSATKAYQAVSDEIDEEADANYDDDDDDDGGGGGGGGDMMDDLLDEGKKEENLKKARKEMEMAAEFARVTSQYDVASLAKPTVDRILTEYGAVTKTEHYGWQTAPKGRDLSTWELLFFNFDAGTQLHTDMAKLARAGDARPGGVIRLEMKFPSEYPYKPPFIRVVSPRFAFRTARVTVGGSICTQLLTDQGWLPTYGIESIVETVREQITGAEAKAAVDFGNTSDYAHGEAVEAFNRVAEHHRQNGWE
jgi:ubiquitin-conjugating enzyme E2 Q